MLLTLGILALAVLIVLSVITSRKESEMDALAQFRRIEYRQIV